MTKTPAGMNPAGVLAFWKDLISPRFHGNAPVFSQLSREVSIVAV
jgi:hypothetical protein